MHKFLLVYLCSMFSFSFAQAQTISGYGGAGRPVVIEKKKEIIEKDRNDEVVNFDKTSKNSVTILENRNGSTKYKIFCHELISQMQSNGFNNSEIALKMNGINSVSDVKVLDNDFLELVIDKKNSKQILSVYFNIQ